MNGGIYLGSLDAKPGEQGAKELLPDASRIAYAPPIGRADHVGYLLFVRGGTLMAQPFDSQRLALAGEAVPVAEQLGANAFSSSDTGVLVYRPGGFVGQQQLVWYDRQGRNLGPLADPFEDPGTASSPAISPDGKRIAYARGEGQSGNADIWLYEIARGISSRFTTGPGRNTNPVWSPDGSRIAFAGLRAGTMALYQKASNLVGGEQLLYKAGDAPAGPPINWSHDGRFILYGAGAIGVWMLPVDGPGPHKPVLLVSKDFAQRAARLSPDGRFFTYISNKAGRDDVYVRSFDAAAPSGSGGEWTVSKDGGDGAHWRKDGKEIYYMAPDRTIMAVEVTTTPSFQPGTPKPLFKSNAALPYWEVTPDGQKFLVPVAVGANAAAPYTVVLNWQAALKK